MLWMFTRNPLKVPKQANRRPAQQQVKPKLMELFEKRLSIQQLLTEYEEFSMEALEDLEERFPEYIAMIRGLVFRPSISGEVELFDKKVRGLFDMEWSDSVVCEKDFHYVDTVQDLAAMIVCHGIYLMDAVQKVTQILPLEFLLQHCIMLQRMLLRAGGMFQMVDTQLRPAIPPSSGDDLDQLVLRAYQIQCEAEAWEIWVVLALMEIFEEINALTWKIRTFGKPVHPQSLAMVARRTEEKYFKTVQVVQRIGLADDKQWMTYLQLKLNYYRGISLAAQAYDQWNGAVDWTKVKRTVKDQLNEADTCRKAAENLYREFKNKFQKVLDLFKQTELKMYIEMVRSQVSDRRQMSAAEFDMIDLDHIDMSIVPYRLPELDAWWTEEVYQELGIELRDEEKKCLNGLKEEQKGKWNFRGSNCR